MRKLDYLYSDLRHDLRNKYIRQKENLHNGNIESFNDYITDDVIGEGGFKHPVEAFYRVLTICVTMIELNLNDQLFFEDVKDMITEYQKGDYDKYIYDVVEDKKEIDKDISKIKDAK